MERHYISDASELLNVVPGDHYYLACSIDLTKVEAIEIPLFKGIFDFCGFVVRGMRRPLFKQLDCAVIKSLFLENAQCALASCSNYCRFHRISSDTVSGAALSDGDSNSQFYMCMAKVPLCANSTNSIFKDCAAPFSSSYRSSLVSEMPDAEYCKCCGFTGKCAHALFEQLGGRAELRSHWQSEVNKRVDSDLDAIKRQLQEENVAKQASVTGTEHGAAPIEIAAYAEFRMLEQRIIALEERASRAETQNAALERRCEVQALQLQRLFELADDGLQRALYCQLVRMCLTGGQMRELANLLVLTAYSTASALNRSPAHTQVLTSDFLTEDALCGASLTDCALFTPLHYAVLLEKPAILAQLIENGAALRNVASGYTALMLAALMGSASAVSMLMAHEREIPTPDGVTALQMATTEECADLLENAAKY